MEIRYTIPDELIEKYRQDRFARARVITDFGNIEIILKEIAKLLRRINLNIVKLIKITKRTGRPPPAHIVYILADFKEAIDKTKQLKDIIDFGERELPELSQYYETNIKPIVENILKKLDQLFETTPSIKNQEDYLKYLEHLDKTKLEISKELYRLKAIFDSTLEILRHI